MSGKFCNEISPVSWLLFYQILNVLKLCYFLLAATLVLWNLKSNNKRHSDREQKIKSETLSDLKRVDGFVMSGLNTQAKEKKVVNLIYYNVDNDSVWLIRQLSGCIQPCFSPIYINYEKTMRNVYVNQNKLWIRFTLFDLTVY